MMVPKAEAVSTLFINVQVERNAGGAQSRSEGQAVFNLHGFVFPSVPNETRRSVSRDLQFVGEEFHKLRVRTGTE